jgi:hypothetical protein
MVKQAAITAASEAYNLVTCDKYKETIKNMKNAIANLGYIFNENTQQLEKLTIITTPTAPTPTATSTQHQHQQHKKNTTDFK